MNYDIVTLGDVCEFLDSQRVPITESDRKPGPYPYYGANGQQDSIDSYIFDEPLVLLAEDGGYFGSKDRPIAYKVTGKCWVNNHAHVLRPKSNIDVDYLHRVLSYYNVTKYINGTTRQKLTKGNAENISFPLPPLDEQKRIASLLARADRLRHLRRVAHELSASVLQSVFVEMFGDVAHSKWDKGELGELIEGFEAGVNYLPGGKGEKVSEWRVLKISAVTWGDFDPTESKAIREYDGFDEKHIVQKGDLLISRANTTELVGAVSLVKIIPPKVLLPDKLWRVKFRKNSAILPEYTLHLLRQPELRKIIGDLATGSSGSMKNISMEKAYTLPIPIPPLSLQAEFASIVARVEQLRARQAESERQADGLFESLLAESFA